MNKQNAALLTAVEGLTKLYVGKNAPSEIWEETCKRFVALDKLAKACRRAERREVGNSMFATVVREMRQIDPAHGPYKVGKAMAIRRGGDVYLRWPNGKEAMINSVSATEVAQHEKACRP